MRKSRMKELTMVMYIWREFMSTVTHTELSAAMSDMGMDMYSYVCVRVCVSVCVCVCTGQ